jgi:hypothetical protein
MRLERAVTGVDGTARMLARPVAVQGRPLVVVTGASLEDRKDALSDVLTSFLLGGPIAVLLRPRSAICSPRPDSHPWKRCADGRSGSP